VYIHRRQPHST